ncbi:MAG: DNA cytosine methyltransferase [Polyangiaceae bacterium]|nr:DNA cytosine methyltransferase [Polyangiaceae bacterium]
MSGHDEDLIVDLFSGAGGISGAQRNVHGRDPDVAINHWETAVRVHEVNHPGTLHLHGSVWHYRPIDVTRGRRVLHVHGSPTCTHFSQAKGGPLDRSEATKVRALAWSLFRWAKETLADVITVENVRQFADWGPLDNDGRVIESRKGETFRKWIRGFERLGYVVEWRVLCAADYGSPTSRERLFIVMRRDGEPIRWPAPTHGPGTGRPWRGAHECIDWSIPAPSIFDRKKPLTEATLRRIARGVTRFVLEAAEPFIVPVSHSGDARVHGLDEPLRTVTASSRSPFSLVVPSLIHVSNGEREGQAPRVYDIRDPLSTVVAGGVKHALIAATIVKNFGGHEGSGLDVRRPLGAVTTRDHHALVTCATDADRRAEVRALLRDYGPRTVHNDGTIRVRVGRADAAFEVADVGMRLLVPRELARAHDFDDMVLDRDASGRPVTKTDQIRLIGNSVPRLLAEAVIGSQFGTWPSLPVEPEQGELFAGAA